MVGDGAGKVGDGGGGGGGMGVVVVFWGGGKEGADDRRMWVKALKNGAAIILS